jgi:hypothetical protein
VEVTAHRPTLHVNCSRRPRAGKGIPRRQHGQPVSPTRGKGARCQPTLHRGRHRKGGERRHAEVTARRPTLHVDCSRRPRAGKGISRRQHGQPVSPTRGKGARYQPTLHAGRHRAAHGGSQEDLRRKGDSDTGQTEAPRQHHRPIMPSRKTKRSKQPKKRGHVYTPYKLTTDQEKILKKA